MGCTPPVGSMGRLMGTLPSISWYSPSSISCTCVTSSSEHSESTSPYIMRFCVSASSGSSDATLPGRFR